MRQWAATRFRSRRLEVISFVTGFSLLTYELAAARVLAPSIGSSTYVWTGVIGVIIAALSFGFFVGGKLADRRNQASDVAWLLILAGVMVAVTLVTYQSVLQSVVQSMLDSRIQAVLAALLLFAPASFFIGVTGPYLAKLNVRELTSTGQAVAALDMFNAIGGICGTFVTGFILFGYIGSHQAIGLVSILLVGTSWLIMPRIYIVWRLVASLFIVLTAFTPAIYGAGVVAVDTATAHYRVVTGNYGGQPIVGLLTGPGGTQSAVYQNGLDDPVFWYTQQMTELAIQHKPRSILVLGGGAFTMPQYLSERLPEAHIDVVEIDPKLGEISTKFFHYKNPQNVTAIFTDARTYVNQATKTYDVILVDVYGDATIPFSLMTREYGEAVAARLKPNGLLVANIIGSLEGECSQVMYALSGAYRQELPYAYYAARPGARPSDRANYVTVYSRHPRQLQGYSILPTTKRPSYSDNYAPAERLYYDCEQSARWNQ